MSHLYHLKLAHVQSRKANMEKLTNAVTAFGDAIELVETRHRSLIVALKSDTTFVQLLDKIADIADIESFEGELKAQPKAERPKFKLIRGGLKP